MKNLGLLLMSVLVCTSTFAASEVFLKPGQSAIYCARDRHLSQFERIEADGQSDLNRFLLQTEIKIPLKDDPKVIIILSPFSVSAPAISYSSLERSPDYFTYCVTITKN